MLALQDRAWNSLAVYIVNYIVEDGFISVLPVDTHDSRLLINNTASEIVYVRIGSKRRHIIFVEEAKKMTNLLKEIAEK